MTNLSAVCSTYEKVGVRIRETDYCLARSRILYFTDVAKSFESADRGLRFRWGSFAVVYESRKLNGAGPRGPT